MSRIAGIESLFHEALALPDGVDRMEWARQRCTDPACLRELISLLDAHQEMTSAPASGPAFEATLPAGRFGAYRPIETLGRGGMSVVYRAERADGQFEQTVALKVMAEYLVDPEFLRRFEAERRLLATLHHQNITRLLDGGISSSGAPYLITEYISGQMLDRYCDERKLDVPARLRIFLQICEAVDYAHRNLVVHRDLKPANILVDSEGVVKLLDFGTASLLGGQSEVTATRMRMLTPRYASPEQLRGEHVNTATDVFSLGIILYELLCGAWPFGDPGSLLTELSRATGEVHAHPPFAAIAEPASQLRAASADQLRRILKGDLSAIVLKAIEHDPARRYGSVRALAADIEAYFAGVPVSAHPLTVAYRARKFLRRRWLPVSTVAVFVVGLLAATVVTIYQAREARAQADRSRRIAAFTNSLFLAPNAMWFNGNAGRGKETRLVDVLESASRRMSAELKDDPLTELTLRTTLARTLVFLAMYDRAQQEMERAEKLLPVAGSAPAVAAELAVTQCDLRFAQTKYREAEPWCRQAVALVRRAGGSPNRLMIPAAGHLGVILAASGNRSEVEGLFHEALSAIPNPTASDRNGILNVRANFASAKMSWGEFDAAASDYRAILAEFRKLEDANGESAMAYANLATCYRALNDLPAAEKELRTAMQIIATHPLGNEPRSLKIPIGLAVTLAMEGRIDEADTLLREVTPRIEKVSTGNTNLEGFWEMAWGVSALKRGQAADAERRFRRSAQVYARVLQPTDATLGQVSRLLASALEADGRIPEARAAAQDAVRIYGAAYAPGNPILEEARAYSQKLEK